MTRPSLATIFSFCTNDWRFFERCIAEARLFSEKIYVTVCDHFFDGTAENYALLEALYRTYPDVTFIEFAYDIYHSYHTYSTLSPYHPLWRHEWHNTGRWISYLFVDEAVEYLYFCDGDEVTEGKRFAEWLETRAYAEYDALRMACYWYFRQAHYQALAQDDMCLLVRKKALDPSMFWDEHERMGLYLGVQGRKAFHVKGVDGSPLVHHYSWVRTREEMLKKFTTWGHYWERNWQLLVEEEFQRPFQGVDFIRHYHYVEETPLFDPLGVVVPSLHPVSLEEHLENVKLFDNVHRVNRSAMFRKELIHTFAL